MKKPFLLVSICFVIVVSIFGGCKSSTDHSAYLGVNVTAIELELNNLMQLFYPRIVDTINGGYWTNFENDWTQSKDQDKMLVTQARGLWTASRAAELFPDNPVFQLAADHGYEFLTRQMWDTLNGGFYQNYYPYSSQKVDPSFKLAYGNAFALFALSQYAKINEDPEVLEWIKKSFFWIENALHDSVYEGYFNISTPEVKFSAAPKETVMRAGWGNPEWKDQNTSIHLLEAFTAAYQVLPDEPVKTRLKEMLELVRDRMTNQQGYLNLYFTNKWEPIINLYS
jgi:mannobiose 2-epimerase